MTINRITEIESILPGAHFGPGEDGTPAIEYRLAISDQELANEYRALIAARDSDHVCHIDCELIVNDDGSQSHVIYPPDSITWTRAKYVNGRGQTRREYRASGLDETRNVRQWNVNRALGLQTRAYRPYDTTVRLFAGESN